jgi:hypothetical protein
MNGTLAPAQNYGFAFVYILIVWALAFLVARSLDSRIVVLL